jgi:hypothetical protein
MWEGPDNSNSAQTSLQTKKTIHKAQKLLGDYKVPVYQVLTKTVVKKYGKVKDILIESSQGLYDAIPAFSSKLWIELATSNGSPEQGYSIL